MERQSTQSPGLTKLPREGYPVIEPKRSREIKYINPEAPDVHPPDYSGQRYEALAPDTIDLQEMARLAVNGLTSPTDEDADYEIYWWAEFASNPPLMRHNESDSVQAKHMEALPLVRSICGSNQNRQVEKRWMELIHQMQGPDGMFYFPRVGRPWCVFGIYGEGPEEEHYAVPFSNGRLIGAATIYHLLTGDPTWLEVGRRAVDGLGRVAIHEGRKARFPWHMFGPGGTYKAGDPASAVHNPATWIGWCIQGLANYYRHTGYVPALDLAGGLSRFVMEDCNHFGPSGEFLEEYPGVSRAHFHGHTLVLLSVLDYGIAAGDRSAIDFAQRGFEYGMTQGDCVLGCFKEWLGVDWQQTVEICEVADMIALAIKLSLAGAGDYWDMADRWTRNLLFESQLRHVEWAYWLGSRNLPSAVPRHYTAERVPERNVGAFAGFMAPNDFLPDKVSYDPLNRYGAIMHCCVGNAARTLYYIWENIATCENGRLRLNLLMNRASRWADVDSHIPYAGQVDVRVKEPVDLSVRIPEWVQPRETACTVNAEARHISFEGRYAVVGAVGQGDTVSLTFPISERTEMISHEGQVYRLVLRGSTCVAIDPSGRNCPLFQRDHLREDATRWRKVTRFVADRQPEW